MEINIKNGTGEIYIGFNELGSYLYMNETKSSTWNCCYGTLAKFLCNSNTRNIDINSIINIQSKLYNNYSNNLTELKEVLSPILNKLKNGNYNLWFVEGEKWKISQDANNSSWDIYIPTSNQQSSTGFKLAYNYYDNLKYRFIGTENENSINRDRIKKYELEIKEGQRPFAIIISNYYRPETDPLYPYKELGGYDGDWNSEKFILDGHHKLLAYKNLGVNPNFAILYKNFKHMNETYFDFTEFSEILNKNQKEHFMKNWESAEKYKDGNRIKY